MRKQKLKSFFFYELHETKMMMMSKGKGARLVVASEIQFLFCKLFAIELAFVNKR